MSRSTPTQPPKRKDRMLKEQIHDTYTLRGQLKGLARCSACGAVYRKGRWSWTAAADAGTKELLCSACHRIADKYPAGELSLSGAFVMRHKEEICNLVRNIEAVENREHPMNRIIDIEVRDDLIFITTTDVHLPRRIGKALADAWEGKLDIHFDKGGYFTRIAWHRGPD